MMDADFLVAVDIGKWVSGLAVFDQEGTLLAAWEARVARPPGRRDPDPRLMAVTLYTTTWSVLHSLGIDEPCKVLWVVEKMVDYDGKGGREEDLEHLRKSVAEMVELARQHPNMAMDEVRAHAWKGNVPKRVTEHRVRGILTDKEFESIVIWTKETWDAIGIGLFRVGRAGRGSVPRGEPT